MVLGHRQDVESASAAVLDMIQHRAHQVDAKTADGFFIEAEGSVDGCVSQGIEGRS